MLEIRPFFTSIFCELLDCDSDKIVLDIKKLQDLSEGRTISNRGGWQSESYLESSNTFMFPLLDIIKTRIQELYTKYGVLRATRIGSYWFNINKKGDYNISHRHPKSILSAVFYFKTPENCGNIVFERSDLLTELNDFDEHTEYSYVDWFIPPQKNLLIVFPSFVKHGVEMNRSDEDRISLAINFI
jgi:uncharacterized protein (TIGR02466 family)